MKIEDPAVVLGKLESVSQPLCQRLGREDHLQTKSTFCCRKVCVHILVPSEGYVTVSVKGGYIHQNWKLTAPFHCQDKEDWLFTHAFLQR